MADIDPVQFGELKASVKSLDERVASMDKKVDELVALANKGRGGLLAAITLSGGAGGLAAWLTSFMSNGGGNIPK